MFCIKCHVGIISGDLCSLCDAHLARRAREAKAAIDLPEMTLSQCDKCGTEVAEHEIDWDMRFNYNHMFKAFGVGAVLGAISVLLLWYGVAGTGG